MKHARDHCSNFKTTCVCPVKRKDCKKEIHIGLDEREGLQVCGHDLLHNMSEAGKKILEAKMLGFGMSCWGENRQDDIRSKE